MKHSPVVAERLGLGLLLLIFTWFTWRGVLLFYSGDDMMNMYYAWNVNTWRLGRALLLIWIPTYRPLGQSIYRAFFETVGFHPMPLYTFCWLLLLANVVFAYRFLKAVSLSMLAALTGLALILVHGRFQDLYISAGTIYDRLCFLFTALGLTIYANSRARDERMPVRTVVVVLLVCILAMDSKESGIALPVLLACYEGVFVWRGRKSHRDIVPLYLSAAVIALIFVFGRVHRTPELATTAAYQPHADPMRWLTGISRYLATLVYAEPFSIAVGGGILFALLALALVLKNRPMLFGWLFFVVTITPVALIANRPGYVLYVPELGLGLYLGALIAHWFHGREMNWRAALVFVAVTAGSAKVHAAHWSTMFQDDYQPQRKVTEQFRLQYPKLRIGSRLLFTKDEFPPAAWDLTFNLRLLYRDPGLVVHRSSATTDEHPAPGDTKPYDHVFTLDGNGYSELDNRDVEKSVRLNILRDYPPGRHFDLARRDHAGYLVSGVMDFAGEEKGRWTAGTAVLKFDLFPADSVLSAKFWVPEMIAKPVARKLSIFVNDHLAGTDALTKDGLHEVSFHVPGGMLAAPDYTTVRLTVDPPFVDANKQDLGVVLLGVDLEYENVNKGTR